MLATLSFHDLVPAIWLPTPALRKERERSRWRLHLVKHRSTLKNRVHSTMIAFGYQVAMADLFGHGGRLMLRELEIPQPWRGHVDASLELIDGLELRISQIEAELQRSGADHDYVPVLMAAPVFGWITSFRWRPSSARSPASPHRPSSSAAPACARASASPVMKVKGFDINRGRA